MTERTSHPLTDEQISRVASALSATPADATELDGGMVGSVHRLDFADRDPVAVKRGPTRLDVEARMLAYLARQSPLPVPTVLHADPDLLVMTYVEGDGRFDAAAEADGAAHLAALHDVTADAFGFPFETLSGPYRQPNPWTDSWIEFFRDRRLRPFARAAAQEGTLPESHYDRVETLAGRLDELLVEPDAPSLIHGDFHEANMVVRDGRVAAVFDPATYFAHDELDLAFVDASDSFGDPFFDAYRERREIRDGFFETRRHVYAVFHALENVRFFGRDLLDRLDDAFESVGV